MNTMAERITISVVLGGFILEYPVRVQGTDTWNPQKEVFTSQRKLNQKLKEVIKDISLVGDDE